MKLTDYLVLPAEISPFEQDYLTKMNRVGVGFFWLNVPLLATIAFFNQTNALFAIVLAGLVSAGPTLALIGLKNPRHVSMVLGFTAMTMGGLFAHFGQGPLQIEMHFYFFSLLAVLVMYANPSVILVAAVTVTLHHTVIYLLLPSSVFNYDASIWVVAVHAAFVVVESVAACFISRSFFDNVIGLDKIVRARTAQLDARNRDMRLVLDHVDQGLFTVDRDALVSSERSAVCSTWFGENNIGDTLATHLSRLDPSAGEWFELGWDDVTSGFLPLEVTLAQLPHRVEHEGRYLDLKYLPIFRDDAEGTDADDVERVLVVVTDVTAQVQREAVEAEQQEVMRIFEHFLSDKAGFLEFFAESGQLVDAICDGAAPDRATALRWLHTLKGNTLIYGFRGFGGFVHELESVLISEARDLDADEAAALRARWARMDDKLREMVGDRADLGLELTDDQYEALEQAVQSGTGHAELLDIVHSWKLEPAAKRLVRLATQAKGIAVRLGKADLHVVTEDNAVRLDPEHFATFWSAFVHVVRNAVDHGIETVDERVDTGKEGFGTLALRTRFEGEDLVVEIEDDGRGIDWDRLASKARDLGLDTDSDGALVQALFADGVSTKETADDISGRGVGMAAVREAAEKLGGAVEVISESGKGTRFVFRFPLTDSIAA